MVESLKQEGTSHSSSDLLKICVKMGASWLAQDFRQTSVTPSGLVPSFSCSFWRPGTSSSLILKSCEWSHSVNSTHDVWMVFFQTCSRTHSDRLPVVDSPQCWGMVSCNWWCLSDLSTLKQNHWKIICSLAFQNKSSLPLFSFSSVYLACLYKTLSPFL